jgi:hypothetical protein
MGAKIQQKTKTRRLPPPDRKFFSNRRGFTSVRFNKEPNNIILRWRGGF